MEPRCTFVEAARVPSRLLGELLVEDGLITAEELEEALVAQTECGKRLGEVLVERKLVSGPELTAALMKQFGVEMTKQEGFGAGLWTEIRRRHRDARAVEVGADPNYPRLEPANEPPVDNLVVLDQFVENEEQPPEEPQEEPLAALATISEAAAFAARLVEADEGLALESAYRENAERDLERLRAEGSARDARLAELEREIANQSGTQGELDALTVRLAEADEMIAHEAELKEEAERALAQLRHDLDDLVARLAAAEAIDTSAPARVAELEAELEGALAESARLESAVSSLTDEAERVAGLLADADATLVREAALRQEVEADLDRLRADAAGRDERLADLDRQVVEATSELAAERTRYATSEEEVAAAGQALTREHQARERVEAELVELRGELNAVVERLAEVEAQVPPPEETYADYVVFAPGATGYELSQHMGTPPELGGAADRDGVELRVVKIGRSPLPADRRRCVYLAAV